MASGFPGGFIPPNKRNLREHASCFVKGVFTLFHKRRTVNTIDVKDTYFGNSPFNSHTEATKLIGTPLSDRLRVCLSLFNLFRYLLRYSL